MLIDETTRILATGQRSADPAQTGIQFHLSQDRFVAIFGLDAPRRMLEMQLTLCDLSPLQRRITLGINSTHLDDPGSWLLIQRAKSERKLWEWDQLGDDETPLAYIQRHVDQMGTVTRLWAAQEPTHLTQKMATQWAGRMGYAIPYPTVVALFKEQARERYGVNTIETNLFYRYLLHWDKAKRPTRKADHANVTP